MASIDKTYEGLQDLILRKQLAFICNRDLELFLREREPKSLEQANKLADQYKEARYVDIVGFKGKYKKCRPDNGETFQQFTTRMKSYFTCWIDMASIDKTYEGLQD